MRLHGCAAALTYSVFRSVRQTLGLKESVHRKPACYAPRRRRPTGFRHEHDGDQQVLDKEQQGSDLLPFSDASALLSGFLDFPLTDVTL